jgi:hypothetical protein
MPLLCVAEEGLREGLSIIGEGLDITDGSIS